MLITNKLQIRHSEITEINGFGLNNWLIISKRNLTFLLFIAQHVHDFQNLSNADRTKSSTFCPNLIQLNLPRNITHMQEVKNNTHPRTGGLQGLCTQIFPSVCDTSCYSADELANRDNWSSLVSPASSQVLDRAVYPILHQPGFTCGSRDFCNSFHSISILWHDSCTTAMGKKILSGDCTSLECYRKHSLLQLKSRGRRAENAWLTIPEYRGDMNQKRSRVTVAGEFIDLWFTALQGPFGMQKERMMKGVVSNGGRARQNAQRC